MNKRHTKNKDLLLEAFSKKHLLTLKELSELLPNIDFSTIYRNVKKFVEDGTVNEVNLNSETVAYELNKDSHDHFVCDNCNFVESVHLDSDSVQKKLPRGFKVSIGRNIIHGTCNKCK